MQQTGIVIGRESWLLLRDEPLYSARFIDREGTDELALVVRVEMLDWFVEAHPPLTVDLSTWCSTQRKWVVVVAYQLQPFFGGSQGGEFYFNPSHSVDAEFLKKFLKQETLYVVFLSEDCEAHYTVGVPLSPQEQGHWRRLVGEIERILAGKTPEDEDDSDFAAAVQELCRQVSSHTEEL
jgi:hypothetical protein